MVMGSNLWEEAREYCIGKPRRPKQIKEELIADKEKKVDDYIGPDTSSLTAFLISLLSLSDGGSEDRVSDEDSDFDEENVASTSGSKSVANIDDDGEKSLIMEPSELDAGFKEAAESPSAAALDELDSDWQLVSESDLMSSRLFTDVSDAEIIEKPPVSPFGAFPLPSMSEDSALLTENMRNAIYPRLPTLVKGRQWVLLYSTLKHGISLRTLYRKSGLIPGPCLLVAADRVGATFGGLLMAPLKPTAKKKYQGTSDSFVFTTVTGRPKVYRSTGVNRYFNLCTSDAIAFGGGGRFALHLDSELLYGSSAACDTFGNPALATTEEFVVKNVELWGFAHTSRYMSNASFMEPEFVPGLYTW